MGLANSNACKKKMTLCGQVVAANCCDVMTDL